MPESVQLDVPRRIQVSFGDDIRSSLKTLLAAEFLPSSQAVDGSKPWDLGVDLGWLRSLRDTMLSDHWRVEDLLDRVNQWPHYLVHMKAKSDGDSELVDMHFLHVKSAREDAIPLMLLHGWPGSFWDFHKIIDPLTNPPPDKPAFHVVIPSLPGYFVSSHPKQHDWSVVDTARLMHRLMTEVVGYSRYCGQGGDWGGIILRLMGSLYPSHIEAILFNMLFATLSPPNIDKSTFTPMEKRAMERISEFGRNGRGYLDLQGTKPFTIGIAIGASPLALLTYIGEKMYAWSDPTKLDTRDVMNNVALYYLSRCFPTSVMIYNQFRPLRDEMMKRTETGDLPWKIKSKVGFSLFPYEIGALPRVYLQQFADVRFYKEHQTGGHFPALDNPDGLIEDIREFLGGVWDGKLTSSL